LLLVFTCYCQIFFFHQKLTVVDSKFLYELGDFLLLTTDLWSWLLIFILFFFWFIFVSIFLEFVGFFIKLFWCWSSTFFSFISKFFLIEFLFIKTLGNKINDSLLLLCFIFRLWLFILELLACFLVSFFWKIHFLFYFNFIILTL